MTSSTASPNPCPKRCGSIPNKSRVVGRALIGAPLTRGRLTHFHGARKKARNLTVVLDLQRRAVTLLLPIDEKAAGTFQHSVFSHDCVSFSSASAYQAQLRLRRSSCSKSRPATSIR